MKQVILSTLLLLSVFVVSFTGVVYTSTINQQSLSRLSAELLQTPFQPRTGSTAPSYGPPQEVLQLLSGLKAHPPIHIITHGVSIPASPFGSPAPGGGFSPSQIRHAYQFDQIAFNSGNIKGDGTGQTIAVIDAYDDPNIASDLTTFDSALGIAAPPSFTKVNQTGGTSYPIGDAGWALEESLDVEWAHGIAPGANILLVEANSNNLSDLFTAIDYARNQPGVSVVTMSWGSTEWIGEHTNDYHFTTPSGHGGVAFVASSGDSGSNNAPQYPSVSSNVIGVGGTVLSLDSSGNYSSEIGWNGSGGGISIDETQPSYQTGVVTQSTTKRTDPDVAYDGASQSPFGVYDTYGYSGWLQVYGTSAGAPQWASLVAIADQGRALSGLSTLDGISQSLPALYTALQSDYHDITSGSNGAYSAGPGYDLVTGRGTPFANLIVNDLGAAVTPPPSGPTVVTLASATPNPVTATTTNLSVLGSDPAGESSLTYAWSVTNEPTGVKTPTFSSNSTNTAKNTTATFYAQGSYTFLATLTDPSNLNATSSVTVNVTQAITSLAVAPAAVTLATNATQQFAATAYDQFKQAMVPQPSFAWSLTGSGTLSATGLYTASSVAGSATVTAATGSLSSSANVTVVSTTLSAPSNFTATVQPNPSNTRKNEVVLSWQDADTGLSGFNLQKYNSKRKQWNQLTQLSSAATSYTDANGTTGTQYRIDDYNTVATSAWSYATAK